MKFQPSHDQVLVEPLRIGETTDGGVVMPETARYRTKEGIIRAIGPGHHSVNGAFIEVKHSVGQRIVYKPYSGSEIKLDGVDFIVISDRDISGVFLEEEAAE